MTPTDNHKHYTRLLHNERVHGILCIGPAGTGKTFGPVKYGVDRLRGCNKFRVILGRPPVPYGETLGFLKGDATEKLAPWLQSMYGVMEELGVKAIEVERWREDGRIIEQTLEHIKGRTFHDALILIDEVEDLSYKEIKMLMTRVGQNSKLVMMGDISQASDKINNPGVAEAVEMIRATGNSTEVVEMTMADCLRSGYAREALESDEQWQEIKRNRARGVAA